MKEACWRTLNTPALFIFENTVYVDPAVPDKKANAIENVFVKAPISGSIFRQIAEKSRQSRIAMSVNGSFGKYGGYNRVETEQNALPVTVRGVRSLLE
jgi:hypothetical protein